MTKSPSVIWSFASRVMRPQIVPLRKDNRFAVACDQHVTRSSLYAQRVPSNRVARERPRGGSRRPAEPGLVGDRRCRKTGHEAAAMHVDQIEQASLCGDEDVDAVGQVLPLRPDRNAAEHHRRRQRDSRAVGAKARSNLARQFPGRAQHERTPGLRRSSLLSGREALEDW